VFSVISERMSNCDVFLRGVLVNTELDVDDIENSAEATGICNIVPQSVESVEIFATEATAHLRHLLQRRLITGRSVGRCATKRVVIQDGARV
jgi:hypothetical protein